MSLQRLQRTVHRNFTFPPSLWPDRELRKYHYTSAVSSRNLGAARVSVLMFLFARQMDSRYPAENVLELDSSFFQGAWHRGALLLQARNIVR